MTPNEIKNFIEANFAGIKSEPRNNPDGWAFYFGEVQRGSNPSRIARAVQSGDRGQTFFKLAVSERLVRDYEYEITNPDERQVRELFERELMLWMQNFQGH
jgi:hypothetical protein